MAMIKNPKLTREQIFFCTFLGIIGNIVYIHTWISNDTNRASWLASFAGILAIIPFVLWLLYLSKFNPEGTIFDTIKQGIGKLPNYLLCIIFIILNICISATHLNMFAEMLRVFVFQNTPAPVFMFIMVLIVLLILNSDIITTCKLIEVLTVIGLINYFSCFIFAFPKMINIKYIIPIFDTSIPNLLYGLIFITSASSELLFFLMVIVSNIPDPFKHRSWVISGIISSAIVFSLAILIIIAMMSPEIAKRIAFGGVNAARLISVGSYIYGLEILVIGTYQFIALGKIMICMYCSWISLKKILGEKRPKLQLTFASLALYITALLLNSYTKSYFFAVFLGRYILLPFSILVLILASISLKIRRNKTGSVAK
ncbi:MAG: Spore germination protein B2 [Firmicutes bacterium ADurb.Bin419]|nr:MAG: Spore germination protein B2 [Firmicutes bacterium ADurb.Bin419]